MAFKESIKIVSSLKGVLRKFQGSVSRVFTKIFKEV